MYNKSKPEKCTIDKEDVMFFLGLIFMCVVSIFFWIVDPFDVLKTQNSSPSIVEVRDSHLSSKIDTLIALQEEANKEDERQNQQLLAILQEKQNEEIIL